MLNRTTVIGHLGNDAEIVTVKSGTQACKFSLAVNTVQGDKTFAQWFNCVIWGTRGANVAPHLKKGLLVFAEGRIQAREWVDKEGQKRFSLDLIVADVQFLGGGMKAKEDPSGKGDGEPLKNDDPWAWAKKAEKIMGEAEASQPSMLKAEPKPRAPLPWNGTDDSDVPF